MIGENETIVAVVEDDYIGHVAIPKGTNLKRLYEKQYYKWYLEEYCKKTKVCKRFDRWLIEKGIARRIRVTVFDATWCDAC